MQLQNGRSQEDPMFQGTHIPLPVPITLFLAEASVTQLAVVVQVTMLFLGALVSHRLTRNDTFAVNYMYMARCSTYYHSTSTYGPNRYVGNLCSFRIQNEDQHCTVFVQLYCKRHRSFHTCSQTLLQCRCFIKYINIVPHHHT